MTGAVDLTTEGPEGRTELTEGRKGGLSQLEALNAEPEHWKGG